MIPMSTYWTRRSVQTLYLGVLENLVSKAIYMAETTHTHTHRNEAFCVADTHLNRKATSVRDDTSDYVKSVVSRFKRLEHNRL